jgi:hypothetical protein
MTFMFPLDKGIVNDLKRVNIHADGGETSTDTKTDTKRVKSGYKRF